ncbi:DUF58 domain-containing protein [Polyangium sp. rjm3]|uniref:DUF58 domain-containing protein n=1 Tax=Polyangium mundeleinium TaxID=2995306 RepID=A0ABT5EIZ7_9BACT|nr:DUF58 domain-containing protein [Polyangium mundeleinium]MDC0741796.1 DUF58 domain-containing protein [Polyangium mundeleinium]
MKARGRTKKGATKGPSFGERLRAFFGLGDEPPPTEAASKKDGAKAGAADLLKRLRVIEIKTSHLANEQLSGSYSSVFRGQGLSFREVRAYNPGDDVRWIDWNVSARMNEAFVKVFVEEREMTVMLVVDASESELFGTRRASKAAVAAEICALCAFSAIRNNDRVGLVLATDRVEKIVPPKKGDKHVMRVVREILGHEPESAGTNLRVALETLSKVQKRRSVAFVVSDFFDHGYERALALAASKHDVIPVVIEDPRDAELPDVGLATFEDLETGEQVLVDTSDRKVRERYAAEMRKMRRDRDKLFKKLAVDTVTIRTDQSYVEPLRQLFAKRARRARR